MRRNKEKMSKDQNELNFYDALEALSELNSMPMDTLIEKIEQGVLKTVEKEYPDCDDFTVKIDKESRQLSVCVLRTVVDDEPIDLNEINIDEARTIDPKCVLGDRVPYPLDPKKFKRGAVSQAKQLLHSDIREHEKERILADYKDMLGELMTGEVTRVIGDESARGDFERGAVKVKLRRNELTLFRNDQLPGDRFKVGDLVCVYVSEAVDKKIPGKKPPKVPVKISRANKEFLRRLFEREVPEIYNGEVVIQGIVREPGVRSKVAVYSTDKDIDPIGACIGPHNSRMDNILKELSGEKIDLIPYSEDREKFIASAISPAQVTRVIFSEENERSCVVYVPENQLSLAIGKGGINANLAVRLTGCRLDIKPNTPGAFAADAKDEKPEEEKDTEENTLSVETAEAAEQAQTEEAAPEAETAPAEESASDAEEAADADDRGDLTD